MDKMCGGFWYPDYFMELYSNSLYQSLCYKSASHWPLHCLGKLFGQFVYRPPKATKENFCCSFLN
uniref:Uncharacterized protein n=1 Tax=Rhizophora mucronata TaxID=61149 RepID=A0A2P2N721_RHIMU